MTTELGLAVKRKSATPSSGTNIRRDHSIKEVSKLVDIDLCIGCKAREVACKEWNDLEVEETHNFGGYKSHEDLTLRRGTSCASTKWISMMVESRGTSARIPGVGRCPHQRHLPLRAVPAPAPALRKGGDNKAVFAVGHSILVIAWHLLQTTATTRTSAVTTSLVAITRTRASATSSASSRPSATA
jgi:hypothetical protein